MVKKLTDGIAVGGDMDLVENCLNMLLLTIFVFRVHTFLNVLSL